MESPPSAADDMEASATNPIQVQTAPPPTKRPEDITKSSDFFLIVGILAGLLFFGALVLWFADRWRKRLDAGGSESMSLTNFREMFEAGELSQEEYERIRAKMAGKMKADLGLTKPPPAPPTPPAPKSE